MSEPAQTAHKMVRKDYIAMGGGELPGPQVYVVSDDDSARSALVTFLDDAFSVSEFRSAASFLDLVASLPPGSIVCCFLKSRQNSIILLENLRTLALGLPVIVIIERGDVQLAIRAMRSGAADVLEWPITQDVLRAIVYANRIPPAGEITPGESAKQRLTVLTTRELAVLKCLVRGNPNKLIAYELGINIRTVEYYRARVMKKMRAETLSDLIRLAITADLPID
jgi:two-component system response regulator FixJ